MTFLEAAVEVLRRAGRPLSVPEIASLAIRSELLTHVGRDPEGTMKARLEAELARPPALARVTAVRPGVFTLTEAAASVPSPPPRPVEQPAAPAASAGRRRQRTRQVAVVEPEPEREAPASKETAKRATDREEMAPADVAAGESAGPRSRRRRRRGGRRSKGDGQARPPSGASSPASIVAPVAAKQTAADGPVRAAQPPRPSTGAARESREVAAAPAPSTTPASNRPEGRYEGRLLADAAHRILREHADRRPIHYRQIADMAIKRKLVPNDLSDPRRAMKIALLDDVRWRRARGMRPRFHGEAGGLFALSNGRLDADLLDREERVAMAARDLGEATRRALLARLRALPLDGTEQLVRRALARRFAVEPTALERHPDHVLLQAGGEADCVLVRLQVAPPERGQMRLLGDRCRQQSVRGMLVSMADVPPVVAAQGAASGVQILDGPALASLLAEAGIGIFRTSVAVEYLDEELLEGLVEQ